MTEVSPELLKRCRDLRNLAERAGTPGEARAAAFALTKLLRRLRIEEAELDADGAPPPDDFEGRLLFAAGRVLAWRRSLVILCTEAQGVACYASSETLTPQEVIALGVPLAPADHVDLTRRGPFFRSLQVYTLFGPARDLKRAAAMYAWLSSDINRAAQMLVGKMRASFRLGFVHGLHEQYREVVAEEVRTVDEKALTIVNGQRDRIRNWFEMNVGPAKVDKHPATRVNSAAYDHGVMTGRQFNIQERVLAPGESETP